MPAKYVGVKARQVVLRLYLLIGFILPGVSCLSQTPLYLGKIPNSKDAANEEVIKTTPGGDSLAYKVSVPTIQAFLPPKNIANGTAVIIFPGGGYQTLVLKREGSDMARSFNRLGVAAFVVKYRLPDDRIMADKSIGPLQDAQQAVKLVRENAEKWNINPEKIGVMGFSAGGHLAATISTHYNMGEKASEEAKPNFSILLYPVISLSPTLAHGGSRDNLLGPEKSEELIKYYSNELQVSAKTPPAFLVHAMDDGAVPVENSIEYYLALKKFKTPAEMHLYPIGGHGYGFRTQGKGSLANWPAAMEGWLKAMGYMK